MSDLLDKVRDLTRAAWDDDAFRKITDAAEMEVETAARNGRFWTPLVYASKERAQAVASWFIDKGFQVKLNVKKSNDGKELGTTFVTVGWGRGEAEQ